MFSGKTTLLYRRIQFAKHVNKKVLIINHLNDTRCGQEIKSHDSVRCEAHKVYKLNDIDNSFIEEADVIAIDEGQFFPDIQDFVKKWESSGKVLHICGLVADYQRNKFGNLLDIVPICDTVTKLTALCTACNNGTKALFTYRLTNEKDTIVIGDKTQYTSLCRKHYLTSSCNKNAECS